MTADPHAPPQEQARRLLPTQVRAAFGLTGPAVAVDGGQGTSVAVDGLVLKPDSDPDHVSWLAQLCARIEQVGFCLPAPVAALDGRHVVDGWSATRLVIGHPIEDDDRTEASWSRLLDVARAFHRALAREGRPAFLDERTHRWAVADRFAFHPARLSGTRRGSVAHRGSHPSDVAVPPDPSTSLIGPGGAQLIEQYQHLLVDETLPSQLVHGDLSGNVLFGGSGAPAVIDVSPYWRPAAYADAVVMVDAFLWWQVDAGMLRQMQPPQLDVDRWVSLLARAGVFRLVAFGEPGRDAAEVDEQLQRHSALIAALRRDGASRV